MSHTEQQKNDRTLRKIGRIARRAEALAAMKQRAPIKGALTGAGIKRWRAERNLTQAQAVELFGCSRRALQMWETGQTNVPGYIALAIAAVSFGLPPYRD